MFTWADLAFFLGAPDQVTVNPFQCHAPGILALSGSALRLNAQYPVQHLCTSRVPIAEAARVTSQDSGHVPGFEEMTLHQTIAGAFALVNPSMHKY